MFLLFSYTYTNLEALQEGLTRGATEKFVMSCGFLSYSFIKENSSRDLNGILIAPNIILTVKHGIVDKDTNTVLPVDKGLFITTHNVTELCRLPNEKKREYTTGEAIDPNKIFPHPTADLCLIKLKKAMNVPILPMMRTKPQTWINGFLVSYAPPKVEGGQCINFPEMIAYSKDQVRHIGVVPIEGDNKYFSLLGSHYLTTPLIINRTTYECRYPKDVTHHRLNVLSNPSDSGAPFIVKEGGQYQLAGLHKGKAIFPQLLDEEESAGFSMIVPLYPYCEWIRTIVASINS